MHTLLSILVILALVLISAGIAFIGILYTMSQLPDGANIEKYFYDSMMNNQFNNLLY